MSGWLDKRGGLEATKVRLSQLCRGQTANGLSLHRDGKEDGVYSATTY